jgi:hypothetical protein
MQGDRPRLLWKSLQAPVEEIATWNIYKETATIKLGSFVYDIDVGGHLPKRDDQVDMTGFRELKTLPDAEAKDVMDVLVNFDFSANPRTWQKMCLCAITPETRFISERQRRRYRIRGNLF